MKPTDTLREALYASGLVQPLEASGRGGSLSCMCRQVPGQEKGWIRTVDAILTAAEAGGFDVHLCRRYVRRAGEMAFGWFFGIEAKNTKALVAAIEVLAPILKNASTLFTPVQAPQPSSAPIVQLEPVINRARPAIDIRKHTEALPRAPEYMGPDPVPPPNFRPAVRMATNRITGQPEVEEMPIPHLYGRDINKPKPGSNKGAAFQGSNSELFKGIKANG